MIQAAPVPRSRIASVALRALISQSTCDVTFLEIALLVRGVPLVSELIRDLPVPCALIFYSFGEAFG